VSSSANVLRDVRERYRTAHQQELERWHALRADLGSRNGKGPDGKAPTGKCRAAAGRGRSRGGAPGRRLQN
jgi:hypothetical protein